MFNFVRKHSKSFGVKVIYILIALSFLLGFAVFIGSGVTSYIRTGGLAPNIVADVNGESITLQEFERAMKASGDEQGNPYLRDLIVMQMVNRILLLDMIKEYGFRVTNDELAYEIANTKFFQDNNGVFNKKIYYQVLAQNNIIPADYESRIKHDLLVKKFHKFARNLVVATDADLWWYYRLKNEQFNFGVVPVLSERFKKSVVIPESKMKEYYDAHKDEFKAGSKKTVEYIEVSFSDYANKIIVNDSEISDYYNANRKSFLVDANGGKQLKHFNEVRKEIEEKLKTEKINKLARADAEKARELFLKGNPASEVAKELGVLNSTIGPISEGELKQSSAAERAIAGVFNSLDEGKISEVIKGDQSYVIAKIVKTDTSVSLSFSEAKESVSKNLRELLAREVVKTGAEQLLSELHKSSNPGRTLEQKGYKVEDTGYVTADSSFIKGIGFAPSFFTNALKLDLKNRFPSAPYEFMGRYYIYWLKDKKQATRDEFEKNIDRLRDEYIEEKVGKFIQELIDDAKKSGEIKINRELFASEEKSPGKIPNTRTIF